jgi:mono/diheme cytochrome c family protein
MPLFQLYGTAQNPVTDQFVADHTGLDAMFDNVQISLSSGNIVVQNKLTSSVIFSAPAANIPAGSFNEGNMPTPTPTPTPTPIDGAALYTNNCSGCHGALATSSKRGTTAAAIQSAITSNRGGMGSLSNLTSAEIQAIATALAPTPTPTPTPTPLPGKVVYDNNCSGCHRLGTYDTAGSAPNLAGSGSKVSSKFTAGVSGHKSITLSATQITDVMQFLDAN